MRVIWVPFILVGIMTGCGYTMKAAPPHGIKTIYVATFKNETMSEPTLEIDLTNSVIHRFIFDGTLRVTREENADAVLKGKLIKLVREPLRYTSAEEISEYRLVLTVDLALWDRRTQTPIWEDKNFVGDITFSTTGPRTKSEEKAIGDAMTELARRIVDRVVEEWPE